MTSLPGLFSRTGLALSVVAAGGLVEVGALGAVGSTDALIGLPPVQRPTTLLVEPPLASNYAPPLTVDGQIAQLPPLNPAVTSASLLDYDRLHYLEASDLGGFTPAPPGQLLAVSSGRTLGSNGLQAQIPLYAQSGNGQVSAFAFVSGPGGGTPVPVPVPPGNGNSNGNGNGNGGNGNQLLPPVALPLTPNQPPTPASSTTTVPNPAPTSTTAPGPGPTPTPTTTAPAPTTTTTTVPGPQFIALDNDHNGNSIITATNMAPGQSASAPVTLTNVGTIPFTLYVEPQNASGSLAGLLTLTIAAASNGQIFYRGGLNGGQSPVAFLNPGASIKCRVTLALPASAGNNTQNESATVDLIWGAQP